MIAGGNSDSLLLVIETQRRGADVLTAVRKELGDLGVGAQQAGVAIAAGADAGIREIEKLSRTIDVNSKRDVAAFKQSAQGVRELAQAAGIAPTEVQKLSTAEAVLEARLKAANQEARAQAAQITGLGVRMEVMSPKVRTAANAMSTLSFSAAGFTAGGTAAIMAAGNLATSLAMLSSSARLAAGATGIGAIAIVLGTVIGLMRTTKAEAADMSGTLDLIRSIGSGAEAAAVSRTIDQQLADARKKLTEFDRETASRGSIPVSGDVVGAAKQPMDVLTVRKERALIESEVLGLTKASADAYKNYVDTLGQAGQRAGEKWTSEAKAQAERLKHQREADAERAIALQIQLTDQMVDITLSGQNRQEALANHQAEKEFQQREREIQKLDVSENEKTQLLDAAYRIRIRKQEDNHATQLALEEGYRRGNRMLAAQTGTVSDRFASRMEEIEAEAAEDLKRSNNAVDVEQNKQLKIRKLQRDALTGTIRDLKTIEDATINSKNRQIRAIGIAAQTLRRLEVGAEAARALVESARAFGKVPGYLAAHQYGSAALSAASGVQLAAAAALGFREAGTGGGGSGGGGGAAGGGGERGTFEPRTSSTRDGGPVVINLITRDPYGRESIQSVMYEINRAGILGRGPIEFPIPATTGVRSA